MKNKKITEEELLKIKELIEDCINPKIEYDIYNNSIEGDFVNKMRELNFQAVIKSQEKLRVLHSVINNKLKGE